jgi:hypothetical protein
VEDKLGSIIFNHLFNGRLEIGKAMREGFYLAVEQANTSIPEKKMIIEFLDALTTYTLRVIFSLIHQISLYSLIGNFEKSQNKCKWFNIWSDFLL